MAEIIDAERAAILLSAECEDLSRRSDGVVWCDACRTDVSDVVADLIGRGLMGEDLVATDTGMVWLDDAYERGLI